MALLLRHITQCNYILLCISCCCQALFEVFFRVLKHCSASTAAYKQQQDQQLKQQHDASDAPPSSTSSPYSSSSSSTADALLSPWPASKVQKKFPLLQPVLEGLGRYSHLISVDYFNDLMAVLLEVRKGVGAAVKMPLMLLVVCMLRSLAILFNHCACVHWGMYLCLFLFAAKPVDPMGRGESPMAAVALSISCAIGRTDIHSMKSINSEINQTVQAVCMQP